MLKAEFSPKAFFLNCMLAALSWIVPKKKNTVLLGAGRGELYKGNTKYIFEKLQHENDMDGVWITDNSEIYKDLASRNLPVCEKNSVKGFFTILRSKYIVIDFSVKDFSYMGTLFGRFNIIQTWHGIALKYIGLDEFGFFSGKTNDLMGRIFFKIKKWLQTGEFKKYAFILAGSETEVKNIQTAFNNDRIEILGYPRNDLLFDKHFTRHTIEQILKNRQYKKVVLYAPTFRDLKGDSHPFQQYRMDRIDKALEKMKFIMLFKKHPHDTGLSFETGLNNIIDITSSAPDIQEILPYIDILVTDYSSVFFDFALTEKPVIYFPFDYDFYLNNCRGMYFDYYKTVPGPFAHEVSELLGLLEDVDTWSLDSSYRKKNREFINTFHRYHDGHSAERFIRHLKNR